MTASQIRHERYQKEIAYRAIGDNPLRQAEAISKHYMALAYTAQMLNRLVEERKQVAESPVLDDAISLLLSEFKRHHAYDFGIELEWHPLYPPDTN